MDLDVFAQKVSASRHGAIFHFTDTRNLDSIKKRGLLSHRRLAELGIIVPAPGGDQSSIHTAVARGLDRYVSLCLKKDHPMEGVARNDGRIKEAAYLAIRIANG